MAKYQYNDYPQSSCLSYDCTNNNYSHIYSGVPTNLSVYNCEVPDYFDCFNKLPFK